MIRSMLDDDFYKFTMAQAVLQEAPDAIARYKFINRGPQRFDDFFMSRFWEAVQELSKLRISQEEIDWLRKIRFIRPWFVDYLVGYRYNPDEITALLDPEGNLELEIQGPWRRTIFWEVKLLSMISEIHAEDQPIDEFDQICKAKSKAAALWEHKFRFADFGTRRRRSFEIQDLVVGIARNSPAFIGTSNMHLAMRHDLRPIGTMAHEWIMGWSVLGGLRHANRFAMESWSRVYGGDLGIALTDTYGVESFLKDFGIKLAKLYDGVRHDSGCPFSFSETMVGHYKKLGIDPSSKTIVFSDGLDVSLAIKIGCFCEKIGIKCSFGIGTYLTNDFPIPPLNIVIKLHALDGFPVVKLSDSPGKETGDAEAVRVAKWTFLRSVL